jgi:hypothetical protein
LSRWIHLRCRERSRRWQRDPICLPTEKFSDCRGRKPGAGVENGSRRRSPSCRCSFETTRLHLEFAARCNCTNFKALFEVEVLESGATTSQVGTTLRE